MEAFVGACVSHQQVMDLFAAQHDGRWLPIGSSPTLRGEGDELDGLWDVHLHQVVHILASLIGGHAPTSTKKP